MLCTVKLSRRLFPEEQGHGLDALIARHGLLVADRHRALGDARALWAFVQVLYRTLAPDVDRGRGQADPAHSEPAAATPARQRWTACPSAPGVYLFYGLNELPLYIGKSIDVRERVAAHFSSDWRSETDLRLSAEIRRIEVLSTAGELGALLAEATLIKERLPAHNHTLRRKEEAGVMRLDADGTPCWIPAAAIDPDDIGNAYGPFSSRRSMREALREAAASHALCWTRLKLEKRAGPCFARQLHRCRGACEGAEPIADHDARLRDALATRAIPRWPFAGHALIREISPDGARVDVHLLHGWQWLGTARDDGELATLLETPPRPLFDLDVTRLLLRTWAREPARFIPVPIAVPADV